TLILDMDPAAALTRGLARSSGEDRFEEFGLPFQQALRAGFLSLADEFPARCHIIDAGRDADAIAADIRALVLDRLT
ncbi:MAG: dTMP kinase, partial [Alterinioella nitratireducens]